MTSQPEWAQPMRKDGYYQRQILLDEFIAKIMELTTRVDNRPPLSADGRQLRMKRGDGQMASLAITRVGLLLRFTGKALFPAHR